MSDNTPVITVPTEHDADLSPVRIQTRADQATERLRNAIQRGSLAPGAQWVTERLLQRWNAQHEAELRPVAEEIRLAVASRDRRRLAKLDTKFHAITWQIADHIVLSEVIVSRRQRVMRLLYETIALMTDDELSGTITAHDWLIESFKRGSGQRRNWPPYCSGQRSHSKGGSAQL